MFLNLELNGVFECKLAVASNMCISTIQDLENSEPNSSIEFGIEMSNSPTQTRAMDECDTTCLFGSLIGMKRQNFEDIYDLYCKHAAELGFSVRKGSTKYNTSGVLVSKCFTCSCEGTRRDTASILICEEQGKKKVSRNITRTGCKALLRAKLNDVGFCEVIEHITEHNHPLCMKEWSHMHRSQRSIGPEKATIIEDMISSGMRTIDSFRSMAHNAGGEEVLGHTKKDHFNFVNQLKIFAIEGGDAQTLIDHLHQHGAENEEFFFRVKLDEDGRLSNVFWRDAMMKEDYMIYGDVVIFDTTYRTNRYNLICAPFVGINNHWKNVMFGCAFISNERIDSFEWLLEVFKKSMSGKSPVTLFTDQDQAIASAIDRVFPESKHRLCIWHLYQNAQSRIGSLKSNKSFKNAFQTCLTGSIDGEHFEKCWSSMISKYGLQDNLWFQRLYTLRDKWCTRYNKDFFSAGILSSQRSESTNSAIGFNANSNTSLTDFYAIFKRVVERWRSNESNDEFQCTRAMPSSIFASTALGKHAATVYTLTIFKDFEKEFLKSLSITFSLLNEELDIRVYRVIDGDHVHTVNIYLMGPFVNCTCKRFDECGLLCCHCFRILLTHSVDHIPECYIKKRWTKLAKQDLWDKTTEQSKKTSPWRSNMVRKSYNLILKSEDDEEERMIIEDGLNSIISSLGDLRKRINRICETDNNGESSVMSSTVNVKNPTQANTKGRKQRIKGFLQKSKKKKSSDSSNSVQQGEFGSRTPNTRLF